MPDQRCPEPDCRKLITADTPAQLQEKVKAHEKAHTRRKAAEEAGDAAAEGAAGGFLDGVFRAIGKIFD